MPATPSYRGRFAPSPTGPLHRGSLVSALASYLDARAHRGVWLIRIEDIDGPRCVPGAAEAILHALQAFGMPWDEVPVWQSQRNNAYQRALDTLSACGLVYPCGCTRREIVDSLTRAHARHSTLAYPGTCRDGLNGKPPRAWRLRVPDGANAVIRFDDLWQGAQQQDLASEVGDFVLKRADGVWAYQLAVVVDDGDDGITHIVRGADLLDSTARQIYLQRCLGLPTPSYQHVPLVLADDGEKLSKQHGAVPLDMQDVPGELRRAAAHLGLAVPAGATWDIAAFYQAAIGAWRKRWQIA